MSGMRPDKGRHCFAAGRHQQGMQAASIYLCSAVVGNRFSGMEIPVEERDTAIKETSYRDIGSDGSILYLSYGEILSWRCPHELLLQ